ncbi:sulfur oxidation c-type cytochrome SoxA [Pseudoduganella sp. OTU4001]|uniref:sulfur oxidation c-type cytochrome SoxA n=1 Tax=Pseudoduganella sp. OTU4001 TaxID=3043854 RepID=UPI00313F0E55
MHPSRTICAGLLGLAIAGSAGAQSTADEIAKYRAMLADGNPAELVEAQGEALWATKRGPKQASLEACDLGKGPGVVAGAYAELPRYFKDTGKVMDAEARLVHCMVTLQGLERADIVKKPFSEQGERATDMEALAAYVSAASRGMKIMIPQKHAEEKAAFERGKQAFYYRAGPYDFACASCHSKDSQRIRLQDLPNLQQAAAAQGAFASWPAYRVSQGALRTMQWRMADCFRQQRFPQLDYNSQAAIDLITYLGVKASGGTMAAPGLKR